MIQKFKNKMILIISSAILLSPALVPVVASAQTIGDSICAGTTATATNTQNSDTTCQAGGGNSGSTAFGSIISTVITVFSVIVGGVSVIMIIVGGFRYIISGGNDSSVAGAKNTIIYALIGLVIVALAQIIVHFVLSKALTAAGPNG